MVEDPFDTPDYSALACAVLFCCPVGLPALWFFLRVRAYSYVVQAISMVQGLFMLARVYCSYGYKAVVRVYCSYWYKAVVRVYCSYWYKAVVGVFYSYWYKTVVRVYCSYWYKAVVRVYCSYWYKAVVRVYWSSIHYTDPAHDCYCRHTEKHSWATSQHSIAGSLCLSWSVVLVWWWLRWPGWW